MKFTSRKLPTDADTIAPDGSEVRLLLTLSGGSVASFRLKKGEISKAGVHKTVDEIWYILNGHGEIWRQAADNSSEITELCPDLCLTIPVGTHFQFRAYESADLSVVAVTMPPWPTDSKDEWVEVTPYWPEVTI
ncbi:MAG: hypothetical protein OXC62_02110 [Aestuariivita sp.]|nr:hypothetical protein [Aestuariivita sp.]